jgi:regulator of protease activity HflC (stomatin/prohibitin superfamily)
VSYFVLLVLLLAVAAGGFIAGRVMRKHQVSLAAVIGGAVLAVLLTFGFSIEQIDAGNVGVVYQFGEIVDQRNDGIAFIAPWQTVRQESIRVQRARFERLTTFSEETQDVFITATLNYAVAEGAVQDLFRDVGPNWFDVLVEARVNNFFKSEVVKYQTVDVAPNREAIRVAARERLAAALEPYSVTVVDLLIDDIQFSDAFAASIEAKQIATQDALREEERVRQVEFEAQQAVARADGEARSTIREAEGQAEANRLLNESLTATVLQYLAIQRLGDNVNIALVPSGQGLLIDPSTLIGQGTTSTTTPG